MKKIFIAAAGRKCNSFNTQFSVFIGDCMALLYSMCVGVKRKFQFVTGGNWKSSKPTCKLVFNRFWKPFKADVQSVLRTLESLFWFFVLIHVRYHKM